VIIALILILAIWLLYAAVLCFAFGGKTQFSLRSLLIVTTLLAVLLGLSAYFSKPPKSPPIDVGDWGTPW
jgi:hypothetical protein